MAVETQPVSEFDRAAGRLEEMAKSDPEVAAVMPDDKVTEAIQDPSLSYQQVLTTVLSGYADRQALGVRTYEVQNGARHHLPTFTTITYRQLAEQAEAISSAWRYDARFRVQPGEFVACVVFTGAEFIAVDIGCVYSQAISVPIQANLASDTVIEILKDAAPASMVVSIDYLDLATDYALQQNSIRSLVVINADAEVDAERDAMERARIRLKEAGDNIAFTSFSELVDIGKAYQWTPLHPQPEGRDALSMLMYTSGSTGTPKGAQIHEGICLMFWTEIKRFMPTINVADAPVNHWMGRVQVIMALASGGTCYFTLKTDLSTFVEDVQIVRPTWMQILPRFAEVVYQNHLSDVQTLVSRGIDPEEADAQMRKKLRNHLGDRVVWGVIGSSPTAPEVKQFFRDCFNMAVVEGYGSTESSGGATTFGDRINRSLVIDYKLRDVPELGYYTTDKPYPRGELVVKTRHQFKGYFKRPEATASVFDENGYVITGDIMEERGPDHLVWLDRRNNVIKLSQAEFVAITPIENAYLGDNPLVTQIYVYGSSYRAFLLAVVVPDTSYAHKLLGHEPSDEELRVLVLEALQARARVVGLKSFEIPRDVVIERVPFSPENGLLSSVRKILRPNLKRRYGDRLEAIYDEMDRQQRNELVQLREANSDLSTRDRVANAVKASLGLATIDPSGPQTYRDLGGDSLGAVGLSKLLEDMFDASPGVNMILGSRSSIEDLANVIDQAIAGTSDRPTFSSVHRRGVSSIRASDLSVAAFLDATTLEVVPAPGTLTDQTHTILITGATGFLGRFLCLEWMETLAAHGGKGKVIAIVRGRDPAAARTRLDEAFGMVDENLRRQYHELAKDHLEVLAGDLALPMLGQTRQEFQRLANEVDQIVHPGALVNHRLSYQDLFEPNVVGTAEVIRLAITGRLKRVDYISTIGVPHANPKLLEASEEADVRVDAPEMPLSNQYAIGYTASKWAGEVMLRDAHERFGLPVKVFRPNMILAHSTYRGQINIPDMFTRLLLSVVATGLAPRSFYVLQQDGSRAKTHYDGTPVDILARAMREIGNQSYTGFDTYNTINMHYDDGVSYDSYVDWVQSAGYPVQRIANHADWYQRFNSKLRNLPEQDRQRSSLDIIEHFREPHPVETPVVSTRQFEEAVGSQRVPHISESFIHKYLGDMVMLGLIPKPTVLN